MICVRDISANQEAAFIKGALTPNLLERVKIRLLVAEPRFFHRGFIPKPAQWPESYRLAGKGALTDQITCLTGRYRLAFWREGFNSHAEHATLNFTTEDGKASTLTGK